MLLKKIGKGMKIVLNNGIRFLSKFTIRDKKIVVFGSWLGRKYSDNPKYLFLQACNNPGIRPVWITREKKILQKLKKDNYEVYMVNSLKGIWIQLRAGYYFICVDNIDVGYQYLGGAKLVNLWHGLPLKKILADDVYENQKKSKYKKIYDTLVKNIYKEKTYISSSSDTITDIYLSAFQVAESKILKFGQPRNDVFFNENLEDDGFPIKYKEKKVILYMPTHRSEGKVKLNLSKIINFKEINELCIENDAIFLIKKHFYHKDEIENIKEYECIKEITDKDYDSQLLLKYTDYLITDYSSCYIDYLLLDRPIIYYAFDYEQYLKVDRQMYFDYEDATAGPIVKTYDELIKVIRSTLKENDSYKVKRHCVRALYYNVENQNEVSKKYLKFITKG